MSGKSTTLSAATEQLARKKLVDIAAKHKLYFVVVTDYSFNREQMFVALKNVSRRLNPDIYGTFLAQYKEFIGNDKEVFRAELPSSPFTWVSILSIVKAHLPQDRKSI